MNVQLWEARSHFAFFTGLVFCICLLLLSKTYWNRCFSKVLRCSECSNFSVFFMFSIPSPYLYIFSFSVLLICCFLKEWFTWNFNYFSLTFLNLRTLNYVNQSLYYLKIYIFIILTIFSWLSSFELRTHLLFWRQWENNKILSLKCFRKNLFVFICVEA